ncbi:hypothetical protein THRCLA_01097 [Thraustotheca clavata]|uniref:Uncharacterized protein n=1 Tax=Thraustotheca clavata TaxID=74557 RepID=A0A1W0A9A0_9STRA|nr:hypothetical protein THRCLA_01097 [Thraustotheca clavata]
MELHPNLPSTIDWPLVSSIATEKLGQVPEPLKDVLHYDSVVNVDLLRPFTSIKAHDMLACVIREIIRSKNDTFTMDIIVGYQGGYLGQQFNEKSCRTIKVKPLQEEVMVSVESILKSTLECVPANHAKLESARITAGYMLNNLPRGLENLVKVWTTWEGIENLSAVASKPPPFACSAIFIQDLETLRTMPLQECFTDTFPVHFERQLQLLLCIEKSISLNAAEVTFPWSALKSSVATIDTHQLLTNPDSIILSHMEDADPSNSSLTLRYDMDMLEKSWDIIAYCTSSTQGIIIFVEELQSIFQQIAISPVIHDDNPSELAIYIRQHRNQAPRDQRTQNDFHDGIKPLSQDPVSSLKYMIKVGLYKLQRDVSHWLTQQTIHLSEIKTKLTTPQSFKSIQWLVYVCAIGKQLALNTAIVRQLAEQAMTHAMSTQDIAPTFHIPLESFVPDRLRLSLSGPFSFLIILNTLLDPFLWSLQLKVNDTFTRTLQLEKSQFHDWNLVQFSISPAIANRIKAAMTHQHADAAPFLDQGVATFLTNTPPTAMDYYDGRQHVISYSQLYAPK